MKTSVCILRRADRSLLAPGRVRASVRVRDRVRFRFRFRARIRVRFRVKSSGEK